MLVSIIVPIFNASDYIEDCVRSLMAQTYKDIEYIFVDDASTDDSLAKLKTLLDGGDLGKREHVVLLHNDVNRGIAFTRKQGMTAATGEYMIQVDSDDIVEPEFIEKLAASAIENDSDVVICDIKYDYGKWSRVKKSVVSSSIEECIYQVLTGIVHGSLCNKLLRSSIIREKGIYPVVGQDLGEDKLVILEYLEHTRKISYVNESLYIYNKTNAMSISSRSRARQSHAFVDLIGHIEALYNGKCKLTPLIAKGVLGYKSLVLGQLLLYNNELLKEHKELFKDVTVKVIVNQPSAPVHYKLAVVSYLCHVPLVNSMLRNVLRLKNKRYV